MFGLKSDVHALGSIVTCASGCCVVQYQYYIRRACSQLVSSLQRDVL